MPEENTDNSNAQTTADEQVNNTAAQTDSGAATDTDTQNQVTQPQPKTDVTKTAEFKSALSKAIEQKIPQLKRQIAKDLTGEGEGLPTVDELQKRVEASDQRANVAEARIEIRDYLFDPKNKTGARAENARAIEKLVLAEIEYDDEGKAANLKQAIETVKSDAPTLFITATTKINGGQGKDQPDLVDFNEQLRQSAGYGSR
jgi:hypothetical protein